VDVDERRNVSHRFDSYLGDKPCEVDSSPEFFKPRFLGSIPRQGITRRRDE